MVDVSLYFTPKRGGGDFTKTFYDLGGKQKLVLLYLMEKLGMLDHDSVKTKAANAILQHWPANRSEEYPVTGIHRLSKAAKMADEEYRPTVG